MDSEKRKEILDKKDFLKGTFDDLMGHRVVEIVRDHIVTEIELKPIHLQPFGLVHGGVYAAMAESAISYCAFYSHKGKWAGVNNNTNFIASAKKGKLTLKAKPIKGGKRSQLWEAEIFNGEKFCAKSSVRLTNLDIK
jgi:uncharacterized protein (TIGR00369 family)